MASVEPDFTENLRRIFAPALKDAGFMFDGRRVFRRSMGDSIQIVDVQVGERAMHGEFTINLGVYDSRIDSPDVDRASVREFHCGVKRRQRLGMLLPPRFPALGRVPFFRVVFGPKDIWWSARNNGKGIDEAKDAFFKYGVKWLEQHTPR